MNEEMPSSSAGQAVAGIESLILDFLRQLENGGRQVPDSDGETISSKPMKPKLRLQLCDRTKRSLDGSLCMKTLSYPRKSAQGSIKPFARLFRVLDITHAAIIEDIPMTKRDLYYKDPKLFGSQKTVDLLVDDLAATLSIERADLNIRATSKGLVCGSRLSIQESIQVVQAPGTCLLDSCHRKGCCVSDIGSLSALQSVLGCLAQESSSQQVLCLFTVFRFLLSNEGKRVPRHGDASPTKRTLRFPPFTVRSRSLRK
ncbi:type IIB DNA topoisomerase-domain-containing protein [Flagelloscypha sp. PMI_526]|nr:type IIB DNA topoisomerase-domain-containing protein [Flagelloscypha sp. PMI_526]